MRAIFQSLFITSLAAIPAPAAPAAPGDLEPPPGAILAWHRFSDSGSSYAGLPYVFLGSRSLQFTIPVPPARGHALDLLWGSKNDLRAAELIVNGHSLALQHGGHNGFQWFRVAVPSEVRGDRYEVLLKPDGKAAFLAEVRLTAPDRKDAPQPDMKAASSKVLFQTPPPPSGEAFPEMRPVWDREPVTQKDPARDPRREQLFRQAEKNARLANEGLFRCRRYIDGWLAHADPATGLIPRNLRQSRDFWNGRDSAADNYPFMVLTADLTDRPLMRGRLLDMLRTETRLTSRVDRLPDDYSFSKQGWRREQVDLDAIMFDAAEYVKDGLIPLTEWLGPSPWSERMIGIMDDIWKHAPIETPFGKLPTLNFEVGGDLLQACSRLYWFTGDRKYLDWAIRLGDYYLLGTNHPTRDLETLRLMDHGCEVINGLSELYVAVSRVAPEKHRAYREPLHAIYDRILEAGRNEHGMLYTSFKPKTGEHSSGLCDTWGYNYDGLYTVYLIDGTEKYREAVRHALGSLKEHYTGFNWGNMDGYADSLEGAINLYNREPIASTAEWIDSEIRTMWGIQQPDGVIEGWHGDGNFARTTVMYALWKTAGVTIQPWRADVRLGAVADGDTLYVSLSADESWEGRLVFDRPRHREIMRLPLDYPRINQFPEWFTVAAKKRYTIETLATGRVQNFSGQELAEGMPVNLRPGEELRLEVR